MSVRRAESPTRRFYGPLTMDEVDNSVRSGTFSERSPPAPNLEYAAIHTAEQLRIGSATLYRKFKSYGLIGGKRAVRNGTSVRS